MDYLISNSNAFSLRVERLFNNDKLTGILREKTAKGDFPGIIAGLSKKGEEWVSSAGNLQPEQPYFIASTTKLFTAALIFILEDQGKLKQRDKIFQYLPEAVMSGLHKRKKIDLSYDVRIRHLLYNTSGIPDYFEGKTPGGTSLKEDLLHQGDRNWTFDEVVAISKQWNPLFEPATPRLTHYSDTNFQLLGKIIEQVTGNKLEVVLHREILEPLRLKNTYLYTNTADDRPVFPYAGKEVLRIPKAMASFGPDGGMVSTAGDTLKFLKAFFGNKLFSFDLWDDNITWNRLNFPLQYGPGMMRLKLPRLLSPFSPSPSFYGHSGLNGAFAFYCPEKELYLAGTTNQTNKPSAPFRLMMHLAREVK